MHTIELTTSDTIGGLLALVLNSVAILVLLGFVGVLTYGAFSQRQLVTSWPNEQEATFRPHEAYMGASHSKAWLVSLISAGVFGIFIVGVYFGVTPEIKDMTKGMNMSNLTKKSKVKTEAAPTPDKPSEKPAEKPAAGSSDDKK